MSGLGNAVASPRKNSTASTLALAKDEAKRPKKRSLQASHSDMTIRHASRFWCRHPDPPVITQAALNQLLANVSQRPQNLEVGHRKRA